MDCRQLSIYFAEVYKDLNEVKKKLVFTTHTPEEAGNEKHDFHLCYNMSYFSGISEEEVRRVSGTDGEVFNHSLCALRMAHIANGVSGFMVRFPVRCGVNIQVFAILNQLPMLRIIISGQTKSFMLPKTMQMLQDLMSVRR